MERVSDRLLDVIGKPVIVERDCSKRHDFHHCPDGWIVRDAVFGRKVLYLRIVGCLVRRIGYPCKKSAMFCLREFWHVRGIDVCERIADEVGMASGYDGANRYLNPCKGIHRHQTKVTVEHVDVPYGVKLCVRAVRIGIWQPERMEIASEPVVAHGLQYSVKPCRISHKTSAFEQSREVGVGLWHLGVWFHHVSSKKKIPVATIGRSLSGGVTSVNYIKSRCQKQVGQKGAHGDSVASRSKHVSLKCLVPVKIGCG